MVRGRYQGVAVTSRFHPAPYDGLLRFRGAVLRDLARFLSDSPLAVYAQAYPDDADLAVAWSVCDDAEAEAVVTAWSRKWATGEEGEEE